VATVLESVKPLHTGDVINNYKCRAFIRTHGSMKSSWADSCVKVWKFSSISRTDSRRNQSLKHWRTFTPWQSCLPEKILLTYVVVKIARLIGCMVIILCNAVSCVQYGCIVSIWYILTNRLWYWNCLYGMFYFSDCLT